MVPVLADVGSVSVNVGAARGAPLGPVPLRTVIVAVWAVLPATVSTNVTLSNQWPAVRTVVTLALLPVAGKGAVSTAGGGRVGTTPTPAAVFFILMWVFLC